MTTSDQSDVHQAPQEMQKINIDSADIDIFDFENTSGFLGDVVCYHKDFARVALELGTMQRVQPNSGRIHQFGLGGLCESVDTSMRLGKLGKSGFYREVAHIVSLTSITEVSSKQTEGPFRPSGTLLELISKYKETPSSKEAAALEEDARYSEPGIST